MAAFLNAGTDLLQVTLTTGLDRTKYIVLSAHGKWQTGQSHNSFNKILEVKNSTYYLQIGSGSTRETRIAYTGTRGSGLTYSDNTWAQVAGWAAPAAASTSGRAALDGTFSSTSANIGDLSGMSADFDLVTVGKSDGGGGYDYWKGWVAEASVWEVDTLANAEALITELATKKATAATATGATCRGYWPLIANENADTYGNNLTATSIAFDAEDPGLSGGGGGGGSTAHVIGFSVI